MKTILPILLFLLFTIHGSAIDPYHQGLVNQLSVEYGLTVGAYYISDDEATTMSQNFNYYNQLTLNSQTISHSSGFNQGVEFTLNPTINKRPFDYRLQFDTQIIPNGEAALLTFWAKGISDAVGKFGCVDVHVKDLVTKRTVVRSFTPLTNTWEQWFIPFKGNNKQLEVNFIVGHLAQTVQIGGIAVLGGFGVNVDALPRNDGHDDYEGSSNSAAWRAAAAARIENHRKADFEVIVQDADGNLIQGASVDIEMQEHEFDFGTAHGSGMADIDPNYHNKLLDVDGNGHGLDTYTFEANLHWTYWNNRNLKPWLLPKSQIYGEIAWLNNNNIKAHGHALIWPSIQYIDVDMAQPLNIIEDSISNHLNNILTDPNMFNRFYSWDVINEPTYNILLETRYGSINQVTPLYQSIFNQTAQIDPTVKKVLNDYILDSGPYSDIGITKHKMIVDGINAGATIDALGFQFHLKYPIPPVELYDLLDGYTGKAEELYVSEFDHYGIDPSIRPQYLKDFLTILFSHEDAMRFTMWNFRDYASWQHFDEPIFNEDWTPKDTGLEFFQLVYNDWWTTALGLTTNSAGSTNIRGFKGKYDVTVSHQGVTYPANSFTLLDNDQLVITLPSVIPSTGCDQVDNGGFDNGTAEWSHFFPGGIGSGDFSVNNGQAVITSNYAGTGWHEQLRQSDVALVKGKSYTVSLDASAVANREIAVSVAYVVGGQAGHYYPININSTNQTYTVGPFIATADDPSVRLSIYLGKSDATTYLDNIKLIEDNCVPQPCFISKNGNLNDGLNDWTLLLLNSASATMSALNSEIEVQFTNPGNSGYEIQARQHNIELLAGETYRVFLEAHATANRSIKVQVAESLPPYNAYFYTPLNITDSKQWYQLPDFTVNSSDPTARLNIYLGNDSATTYLDNIWIERVNCSGTPSLTFDLKTLLEGAFDFSAGTMRNRLYQLELLPGMLFTNPSQTGMETPAGQPYSVAPWSYPGTEGLSYSNPDYDPTTVDWILMSLRTGVDANTDIHRAAGLLKQDGTVEFLPGSEYQGNDPGPYYVLLEHRNHIGVLSAQPVTAQNSVLSYDFTTQNSWIQVNGGFGQKELSNGLWGMYAGDGDQLTDVVSYDINGADRILWSLENGLFMEYRASDYDLSGEVTGADRILWNRNSGINSGVPK